MTNNRRILKIIQQCPAEMENVSMFKTKLDNSALKFKQPLTLSEMGTFNLLGVIRDVALCSRNSNSAAILLENVHRAEAIHASTDDFI